MSPPKHEEKIGLLGISFDGKSSFLAGAAQAPDLIRQVLTDGSSNKFSESGNDPFSRVIDEGNLLPASYEGIYEGVYQRLAPYSQWVILGGDHSITYPIVKALTKHSGPIDILHFDAHADIYDEFEGDRYSHACPFARIMEENLCSDLIQVGIRTLTPHQRSQIARFGVRCIDMRHLHEVKDLNFNNPVYISVDMDAFDPAYAPGVSHMEPGGLSPRTVIHLIQQIKSPILGADIVEYNPKRDHHHMTAYLAAKILKEITARMIETS